MKSWFGNLFNFQPRSNLQFGAWCVIGSLIHALWSLNHRLTLISARFLSIHSTLVASKFPQSVFPQENITPVSEKSRLFLFLELLQEGLGQNKKLTTQLSKWQAVSPKNSMMVWWSLPVRCGICLDFLLPHVKFLLWKQSSPPKKSNEGGRALKGDMLVPRRVKCHGNET